MSELVDGSYVILVENVTKYTRSFKITYFWVIFTRISSKPMFLFQSFLGKFYPRSGAYDSSLNDFTQTFSLSPKREKNLPINE